MFCLSEENPINRRPSETSVNQALSALRLAYQQAKYLYIFDYVSVAAHVLKSQTFNLKACRTLDLCVECATDIVVIQPDYESKCCDIG